MPPRSLTYFIEVHQRLSCHLAWSCIRPKGAPVGDCRAGGNDRRDIPPRTPPSILWSLVMVPPSTTAHSSARRPLFNSPSCLRWLQQCYQPMLSLLLSHDFCYFTTSLMHAFYLLHFLYCLLASALPSDCFLLCVFHKRQELPVSIHQGATSYPPPAYNGWYVRHR